MRVYFDDDRESVGLYKRLVTYDVTEDEGLRLLEIKGFLLAAELDHDTDQNMKHVEG